MAITFPASPALNEEWTQAGVTWKWDAQKWVSQSPGGGGGGASVEVGETPPDPAGASEGDLFWSSTDTNLYILYIDDDGPQWVEASPGGGGGASDSFWVRASDTLSPANAGDGIALSDGGDDGIFAMTPSQTGGAYQLYVHHDDGLIHLTGSDYEPNYFYADNTQVAIGPLDADAQTHAIELNHDGSINATGALRINTNRFILGSDGSFTSERGNNNVKLHQSAYNVTGDSVPFAIYEATGNTAPYYYILEGGNVTTDGSITAAGQITANVSNASGDDGAIKAVQTNSNGYALWVGSGATAADRTAFILPNGEAGFNGNGRNTNNSLGISSVGVLNIRHDANSDDVFVVYSGDKDTATTRIKADGSISTGSGDNQIIFNPNEPRQYIVDPAGGTRNVFEIYSGGSTAANKRLSITNDGAIKLGGSNVDGNPNFAISETGFVTTQGVYGRQGGGGTVSSSYYNFYWTGTSMQMWVDAVNLGDVNYTSDYRVKRDVQPIESDAVSRIKALNPVSFKRNNYGEVFKKTESTHEGFIAHEVQEVIPSGATGTKDCENEIQSLRLDAILAVTVKALQESVTRIETLEAKLAALSGPSTTDIQEAN